MLTDRQPSAWWPMISPYSCRLTQKISVGLYTPSRQKSIYGRNVKHGTFISKPPRSHLIGISPRYKDQYPITSIICSTRPEILAGIYCAVQPDTNMSTISNESIIAIVSLVATCPPSLVLIWHLLRRNARVQRDLIGLLMCQRSLSIADSFLDDEFFHPAIDRKIIKHVDDTLLKPTPTYLSRR